MRRPLVLTLTVAVLSGLCAVGTAQATPTSSASPAAAEPPSVPGELLVGYVKGAKASDRDRARGRASAQRKERVVAAAADRTEVELVRLPAGKSRAQAEKELESDSAVAYAEPNWIYQHLGKPIREANDEPVATSVPNDPYYTNGSLWGMYGDATLPMNQYGSQAGEAWALHRTGSPSDTVTVGVIDEGIQYLHEDLQANAAKNPREIAGNRLDDDKNGYVDDVYGWDFANNDSSVYDGGNKGSTDKHGTHVAGTMAASGRNGKGVVGVGWHVKFMSGKFLGRNGGTTANAIKAVDYFTHMKVTNGVNVVATNNSWGGGGFSQLLLDAINRGGDAGILFIAAAGNGGSDGVGDDNDASPHWPSNYVCTTSSRTDDCVVSVAAITSSGDKSGFSNYGATTVDLGAPGSGVYSTLPSHKYGAYSGTSMATPHVTGAAALYASLHPTATAKDIRAAVIGKVVPTPSLNGFTVTNGRLDVSGF